MWRGNYVKIQIERKIAGTSAKKIQLVIQMKVPTTDPK